MHFKHNFLIEFKFVTKFNLILVSFEGDISLFRFFFPLHFVKSIVTIVQLLLLFLLSTTSSGIDMGDLCKSRSADGSVTTFRGILPCSSSCHLNELQEKMLFIFVLLFFILNWIFILAELDDFGFYGKVRLSSKVCLSFSWWEEY